jgi:glycosyltransferase involved in cell wall biosynthesis
VERAAAALTDVVDTPSWLAELASTERIAPLIVAGLRGRADLYIAHNLQALPAAAVLARAHGALLAFDSEDDHLGELLADAPERQRRAIEAMQARWLPRCAYVTAPSDGIADLLAREHGIARPTVVHNVFPWAERAGLDGLRKDRRGAAVSLYWYSQTVGLDRGVQDVVRAAGLLRGDFELHLRGHAGAEVRDALGELARASGVASRVHFHEQVHPNELLSRSAEHDIGLALEQPVSRNRLETATNKIFFYLCAGLAVAATATPGQTRIVDQLDRAALSYPPGDHVALATGLQRWLDDPAALARAKTASLEAARTRWCWEIEREQLLACVRRVLPGD